MWRNPLLQSYTRPTINWRYRQGQHITSGIIGDHSIIEEVVVDSEVFVVRVYEVRFLGIVTGKQGIQSKDKMVKEPVADVGESSSGSLETDDRWKKSV
ncbi:hypothetical protein V6N12_048996 [Hibiscus sabdariffa]|uniref:Uncharacterized protein n=1 Tax=Hibiscus sabdariffa TaxID=183260 RepID=A0ABR2EIX2_9ROSI